VFPPHAASVNPASAITAMAFPIRLFFMNFPPLVGQMAQYHSARDAA
jgi:hypothetical protein